MKASPMAGQHRRLLPTAALQAFVEHFWFVRWDLREQAAQSVATLPHPSVHMVFEQHRAAEIAGVHTDRFVRVLSGQGAVFGIKFRPGGFYAFLQRDVHTITNQRLPVAAVFGDIGDAFASAVAQAHDDAERLQLAEAFLLARAPQADPALQQISAIVTAMMSDRGISKVDDLVARFGLAKRQLQRVFLRHVGVQPKWIIQRYRLHEALAQLTPNSKPDWARLALDLGYSDQAHFINDFKSSTGDTPHDYWQK